MPDSDKNRFATEQADYLKSRRLHWDASAREMDIWRGFGRYYHRRIADVFRFLVPTGQKVIEIGCAKEDLLAALDPAFGVGVDFSGEMIQRARKLHPELIFIHTDALSIDMDEHFDFVILLNIVNDLWDVQSVFQQIIKISTPRTRVIINSYSRLWELPLLVQCDSWELFGA